MAGYADDRYECYVQQQRVMSFSWTVSFPAYESKKLLLQ